MAKWEMEMEEVEAVLDRIWDLHDKLSDAIHAISRSHFLNSLHPVHATKGFVFVKDPAAFLDPASVSDARSLACIRNALENLEDHLESFHTMQCQQQAERDAAIAQLEQSRIILAMRLADHQGKRYQVIEEALAFVGGADDAGLVGELGHPFEKPNDNSEVNDKKANNVFTQVLMSSMTLAEKSIKFISIHSFLGNATLFAVSMLALFQLHQVAFKTDDLLDAPKMQEQAFSRKISRKFRSLSDGNEVKHLDVLLARG